MDHKIAMGGKGARKEGKTLLIMRRTRPHEQDCKGKEKKSAAPDRINAVPVARRHRGDAGTFVRLPGGGFGEREPPPAPRQVTGNFTSPFPRVNYPPHKHTVLPSFSDPRRPRDRAGGRRVPPSHPASMPAAKRSGASCPRAGLTGEQPPAITSVRRPGGARPSQLAAAPRPSALRKRPPAGRGRDEGSAIPRGHLTCGEEWELPGAAPASPQGPLSGRGVPLSRAQRSNPNGHPQRSLPTVTTNGRPQPRGANLSLVPKEN